MGTFSLSYGELIDEAFERAGIAPDSITARHLISARRSMGLLMTEIEAAGQPAEFRQETISLSLQEGQAYVVLPADTIDLFDAVIRTGTGADFPLGRSNRQEWLMTADKTVTGLPTSYWVSKSLPGEFNLIANPSGTGWGEGGYGGGPFSGSDSLVTGDQARNIAILWPVFSGYATGTFVANRIRQTSVPTMLDDDVDARRNWFEIYCSGLAAKIAEKFNPEREADQLQKFTTKLFSRINSENEGDVTIGYRAHGFGRRRRH